MIPYRIAEIAVEVVGVLVAPAVGLAVVGAAIAGGVVVRPAGIPFAVGLAGAVADSAVAAVEIPVDAAGRSVEGVEDPAAAIGAADPADSAGAVAGSADAAAAIAVVCLAEIPFAVGLAGAVAGAVGAAVRTLAVRPFAVADSDAVEIHATWSRVWRDGASVGFPG